LQCSDWRAALVAAQVLEWRKNRILQAYLNRVPFRSELAWRMNGKPLEGGRSTLRPVRPSAPGQCIQL